MANGLLGAIANPALADVSGSKFLGESRKLGLEQQGLQNQLLQGRLGQQEFQAEQQQIALQQQQAQAERQAKISELTSEVLGQSMGGKLADLSKLDPKAAMLMAKELNIPLDQPGRMKNLFGVAQFADNIATNVGIDESIKFLENERDKLSANGIETPVMDNFIQEFKANPQEGIAGLKLFVNSGVEAGVLKSAKRKTFTLKKGDLLVNEQGEEIANNIRNKGEDIEFKDFRSLNNDVTNMMKDTVAIKTAANSLSKLSETKSPSDQLAAIFTFMKALDPTSVVREGEQEAARRTGGVADAFVGFIDQIQGEGGLPAPVFNNMVKTAKRLSNQAVDGSISELTGSLDAFGDRLSDQDKQRLIARAPAKFQDLPQGIPEGSSVQGNMITLPGGQVLTDNGDGSFTTADGQRVVPQ